MLYKVILRLTDDKDFLKVKRAIPLIAFFDFDFSTFGTWIHKNKKNYKYILYTNTKPNEMYIKKKIKELVDVQENLIEREKCILETIKDISNRNL